MSFHRRGTHGCLCGPDSGNANGHKYTSEFLIIIRGSVPSPMSSVFSVMVCVLKLEFKYPLPLNLFQKVVLSLYTLDKVHLSNPSSSLLLNLLPLHYPSGKIITSVLYPLPLWLGFLYVALKLSSLRSLCLFHLYVGDHALTPSHVTLLVTSGENPKIEHTDPLPRVTPKNDPLPLLSDSLIGQIPN